MNYQSSIYLAYWKLTHKGNALTCNICGYSGSAFIPYGEIKRKNARCPNCLSLERHRLQWLYMNKKTSITSANLSLLHFAPETTLRQKFEKMENIKYVTCDYYQEDVMINFDITSIPFKDNSFDVILCNHVLEHIINDDKAMKELFRVLKKGGWAIFQTPVNKSLSQTYEDPTIVKPEDRLREFGQADHVRIYGNDKADRLRKAGFNVKVDDFVKTLPEKDIQRYALARNEDIYFCTK